MQNSECRKLGLGLPRYFPCMQDLFQNIAVDGSTSTIPGAPPVYDAPGTEEEGDLDCEPTQETVTTPPSTTPPSTTSSRKRSLSTQDTGTSPSRGLHVPKRVPVATVMQGLVDSLHDASASDKDTLESITSSMMTSF